MTLHPDPVPLRADADGNIYVGTSRVLLDTVVNHYRQGLSAEDIARGHDTITLADVHAVVAYYLRHRDDVDAYLRQREGEAAELRQRLEAANAPRLAQLRAKIDAARAQRDAQRAATAD